MPAPRFISPTNRPWSRQLLRRPRRCRFCALTLSADMRTGLASLRRLNNPGCTCTLNTESDERKDQERRLCYTRDPIDCPSVASRDYHSLSHFEIDGAKRIYQYLF